MKKSIVIITLLLVTARSVYGGENQTWGQWLNQMLNPYQYEEIKKPSSSLLHYFVPWVTETRQKDIYDTRSYENTELKAKVPYFYARTSGLNPYFGRINTTSERSIERRTFEPLKALAIVGTLYLAGQWVWDKFMISSFKRVENKIKQTHKANQELLNQIIRAKKSKNITDYDFAVLTVYENTINNCLSIYTTIKNTIEQQRKQKNQR